jgi:hypothetical protein
LRPLDFYNQSHYNIGKRSKRMSDFDYFSQLLRYDPDTGKLFWKQPKPGRRLYRPAGHKDRTGYIRIMINYKMYLAHRIAWLLVKGMWPVTMLDHIDRDPSNNRMENLRESNHSENGLNSRPKITSQTGVRGVDPRPNGRFSLRLQGKYLGVFDSILEAKQAKERFLCCQQPSSLK